MANNYLEFSAFLEIPPGKIDRAREIVEREVAKLEKADEWEYCGTCADVKSNGVWFHADESGNTDHVEAIARALVEELEIDEPFVCSWAYTCSAPRVDEFGGGALLIRRGHETVWIDAHECACKADKARLAKTPVRRQKPDDTEILKTLEQGEDIISGIEAQADNRGIDLEEARYWWRKARKLIDSRKEAA